VVRQYCGLQRQVANCQKLVTAALWSGARAYFVGAALYLPELWDSAEGRRRGRFRRQSRGSRRGGRR
jgi:hypothetical protein